MSPRAFHLVLIIGAAIPIGYSHAADAVVGLRANSQCHGIKQFIADMHTLHQSDDHTVAAQFPDVVQFAFECRRCSGDAWRCIVDEAQVASPSASVSLRSSTSDAEVRTITSPSGSSTKLTTNSPVRRQLRAVSFGVPSSRFPGQNISIGGSSPIMLKNEKGAALTLPFSCKVVTQAIGRGVMSAAKIG